MENNDSVWTETAIRFNLSHSGIISLWFADRKHALINGTEGRDTKRHETHGPGHYSNSQSQNLRITVVYALFTVCLIATLCPCSGEHRTVSRGDTCSVAAVK
jgi:hypothetical protein